MTFKTRRIFKSATTGQNTIRELLQFLFLGELIAPSRRRVWIVSPWISNVVLIDNRAATFTSINPEWASREIRLIDVAVRLMAVGCPLGIATSLDEHNVPLLDSLQETARESGVGAMLSVVREGHLHTKGILTSTGLLTGSMNLTFKGLEINDETVEFDTLPSSLAQARLTFESYSR